MMKQFFEAKKVCPEAILLFRMGDFYETFYDDAKTAAKILGLSLTSREKGADATPMAGFPHHQLDQYIAKIIVAGYRCTVCEQIEDPKTVKSGQIVKRAITRIVSAGTVTEETLLDPKELNYLAAVCTTNNQCGLAWVELSTGAFYAATVPAERLNEHLARIAPTEILIAENAPPLANTRITKRPDWAFNLRTAHETLLKQFNTATLDGFGFNTEADEPAIRAAGAVLDYLNETQRQICQHIDSLHKFRDKTYLEIDENSRRSLEISRTIRSNRRDGSLLGVIDRCTTSMGSRQLSEWIAAPLVNIDLINRRLDAVETLYNDDSKRQSMTELLRGIADLQRVMTRVIQGRCTPRDLKVICKTLTVLPKIKDSIAPQAAALTKIAQMIDPCEDLATLLENALADEIPLAYKDGRFIRGGFNAELDELRELQKDSKEWMARFQADEIKRSGIGSLKIGYTQVFGYYIEITNTHNERIPHNYVRKQTLKNAERYITPELKEYEEKVLTAAERSAALELEIFAELRQRTCEKRLAMQNTATALAALDVFAALAQLARENGYCRPKLVQEPVLKIIDGRHPVLDAMEPPGTFVPNDTILGSPAVLLQLITGPNMSGKSTFIRQTALLCILAQAGSFLPAKSATIGICDRIFARVGASDEISRGQSTFMVEMTETARILHQATPQSLVILDEIGRGTSTYDGLSLAWAITEYLHNVVPARTLFATHYHELTDLAEQLKGVGNLNVAVREEAGDGTFSAHNITFLHKIVQGAADKSYGIHVAKIAGVPKSVVERAAEILEELEKQPSSHHLADPPKPNYQYTLFGSENHPVLDELRELNIDELKPVDALQLLAKWKQETRFTKTTP